MPRSVLAIKTKLGGEGMKQTNREVGTGHG